MPIDELDQLLNDALIGTDLKDKSLRTRSKFVNEKICSALGYTSPSTFKKSKPRLVGQNLDKYIQKANNLQIWNDEIDPDRRYAIIRVDQNDVIEKVRVVEGKIIAELDTTGTLTQKYQARVTVTSQPAELAVRDDSNLVKKLIMEGGKKARLLDDPAAVPSAVSILAIEKVFERVKNLVGATLKDPGITQERNRGGELHQLVCKMVGYGKFRDDGQFPDLLNQLLEVKLQTSQTIDLGLVSPDSRGLLKIPKINGIGLRHCDVRYLIVVGKTVGGNLTISNVILTNGENFFSRFPRFQGKIINTKLQIPLPSNFFD